MMKCKVCSEENAQHHYGTTCCPSCKGFFRRMYLSGKTLECYRGNCCNITKLTRNLCRACRYKKCIMAGLNVNEIRGRAETNSPSLPDMDSQLSIKGESERDEDDKSSVMSNESIDSAEQLVNLYLNLDRFCESTCVNPSEIQCETDLIDQMMKSTVIELVIKSCPQCPRFPLSWRPNEFIDATSWRRSWARDIVNMLDWTNHFAVFKKLTVQDRASVFIDRFTQFSLFTKCYRTYKEGCSGLLLGCGNVFPYDRGLRDRIQDNDIRRMYSTVTDSLFAEVILPMHQMKMRDSDYVLLKACIILFEGFTFKTVSPEARAIISKEREFHRAALQSNLMSLDEPFQSKINHVIQIEYMLTSIESVSNFLDKEIQFLDVFNQKMVEDALMREIHVDKYRSRINRGPYS